MPDVCGMLKICRDAKKHPREATEIFWTVFGLSTHTTFHSFEPVVTCVPLNTRISIFYGARIENLLLIGYFTSDVFVYVWPAQPIKWKISFPDIIILYTYMWHTYTTSNVNGNQYRLLWVSFSASIRNFRRPDFICVFFFFFVRSITVCSATEHCYVRHTSVALRTRFRFWWYHESIFLRKFDFHLIFHWKKQKPILPTGKSLQRTHHRHKEDSQT